jgi:hypothetical protein
MLLLVTYMFFLESYKCVFTSSELAYLEQREPISTRKTYFAGSIPFKN